MATRDLKTYNPNLLNGAQSTYRLDYYNIDLDQGKLGVLGNKIVASGQNHETQLEFSFILGSLGSQGKYEIETTELSRNNGIDFLRH